MKKSQKTIILDYLYWIKCDAKTEEDEWVREYKLRSVDTPFGWLGFQADRRCRELYNTGQLERRLNGKYAEYRFKVIVPESYIQQENHSQPFLIDVPIIRI